MPVPDTYVLIDLETTGANPVSDRITEIAMIRVERGEIVDRWDTLVNPGRDIPAFIQQLIGITDAMVADAPPFAEVAGRVSEMLEGAVFVAHNARFDYGFICNEFQRIGQTFLAPVMCTVKLSRALYPQHHRHGLDALIERYGFQCDARHRAMGDTDVLWQFLVRVGAEFPTAALERAWERAMKFPARPPALPEGILEGLPDAPGTYVLYGDEDEALFVGRAASLRGRLMEQFAAFGRKGKEGDLVRAVRKLDWFETPGELAASLMEIRLIAEHSPRHNRATPVDQKCCGLQITLRRRSAPQIRRVLLEDTDPAEWGDVHGVFRGRKEADVVLREITGAYGLCPRRLGLEAAGVGACTARKAGRCAGVCAGRETPEEHDERLVGALAAIGVKPWQWDGPVAIVECSEHNGALAYQVFDRWCHLGSADSELALASLAAELPPRAFSLDVYRLLQRWLGDPERVAQVKPL